jgi:hypothetical protein
MYQHRQIHIWITESDYLVLREQSVEARESVSSIVRRLVKAERQRIQDPQPSHVPAPEPSPDEMLGSCASEAM